MSDRKKKGRYALGEAKPESKLTAELVRELRARPFIADKEFAKQYGLSTSTVRHARVGLTWKWVV